MKNKILEGLKKTYSDLGLPTKLLEKKADQLSKWIPADADDAKVQEYVDSCKDELKEMQAYTDKRTNDALEKYKKEHQTQQQEEVKKTEGEETAFEKEMREFMKKQQERLDALEAKEQRKTFDERVVEIAKEFDLGADALDFAKAKLSSDMTDEQIKDSLGASKQAMIRMKLSTSGRADDHMAQTTSDEVLRKQAEKWADSQVLS